MSVNWPTLCSTYLLVALDKHVVIALTDLHDRLILLGPSYSSPLWSASSERLVCFSNIAFTPPTEYPSISSDLEINHKEGGYKGPNNLSRTGRRLRKPRLRTRNTTIRRWTRPTRVGGRNRFLNTTFLIQTYYFHSRTTTIWQSFLILLKLPLRNITATQCPHLLPCPLQSLQILTYYYHILCT